MRTVTDVRPDLVVLDVMLPGFDGLEVCRRIQAEDPVPVLMLTARDDETDMLVGLGVGADDYMSKPFSMRELVARLKALLRRVRRAPAAAGAADGADPQMALQVGDLVIDRAGRRVMRAGVPAHLTPTEFDLLLCLANAPGTVLTREQLLADVWDWVDATGTRTVDSHVKALRRKLGRIWCAPCTGSARLGARGPGRSRRARSGGRVASNGDSRRRPAPEHRPPAARSRCRPARCAPAGPLPLLQVKLRVLVVSVVTVAYC